MQSHVRCRRTHKCMHITCQACAPLASTALSVAQRMWPNRCWVPALCVPARRLVAQHRDAARVLAAPLPGARRRGLRTLRGAGMRASSTTT